jgi:hypothetical protein
MPLSTGRIPEERNGVQPPGDSPEATSKSTRGKSGFQVHSLSECSMTMSTEKCEMTYDFCPQAGRASLPGRDCACCFPPFGRDPAARDRTSQGRSPGNCIQVVAVLRPNYPSHKGSTSLGFRKKTSLRMIGERYKSLGMERSASSDLGIASERSRSYSDRDSHPKA